MMGSTASQESIVELLGKDAPKILKDRLKVEENIKRSAEKLNGERAVFAKDLKAFGDRERRLEARETAVSEREAACIKRETIAEADEMETRQERVEILKQVKSHNDKVSQDQLSGQSQREEIAKWQTALDLAKDKFSFDVGALGNIVSLAHQIESELKRAKL